MRGLYSLLWWLALPLVLGRLWWRGRREPGYRQHLGERLGFYGPRLDDRLTIMVHAVSVGETRAAEPLVEALLRAYPDCRILLTHIAAAFLRPTVEIYCDSPKWKTEGNWSPRIVNLGELGAPPQAGEVIAAARGLLDTAWRA